MMSDICNEDGNDFNFFQYGSGKSGNHTFHSPVAYSCNQVNVVSFPSIQKRNKI